MLSKMAQSSAQNTQRSPEDLWRDEVRNWYPDMLGQTYCVPPVFFNRVPYKMEYIAGTKVLVLDPQAIFPTPPTGSGGPIQASGGLCQANTPGGSGQTTAPCQIQAALSCPTLTTQVHPAQTNQPHPTQTTQSGCSTKATLPGPGRAMKQPTTVKENAVKDDFGQQHVLTCLQSLGKSRRPEAMFILSNLLFQDFLIRSPARPRLPKGEFDVIIVSRRYGICVGEIKSVGLASYHLSLTEVEKEKAIVEKIKTAMKQLPRQKETMETIINTSTPGLRICAAMIFPYVTRAQLKRAMESIKHKQIQKLQKCLGANDIEEATQFCLCADDLSERKTPWVVSADVVSKLDGWFMRRFGATEDPQMTDDAYIDLIARLCGPATAVYVHCPSPPRLEVHTIPEAVSLVGERMTQIVLTPEQLDLLNAAPDRVWITGPPGTGKTITAVLMGLIWLSKGLDVHIVSTEASNMAASFVIVHQLISTLTSPSNSAAKKVGQPNLLYLYKHEDIDNALLEFERLAATGKKLHIIMDEQNSFLNMKPSYEHYRFINMLIASVPELCLWVNSWSSNSIPDSFEKLEMTVPLRCPQVVFREVEQGIHHFIGAKYSKNKCPPACEGPPIILLNHSGEGHSGRLPIECTRCGEDVAHNLHKLISATGETSNPTSARRPPALQLDDVLVITEHVKVTPVSSADNQRSDYTCGFVDGLRRQRIPVRVLPRGINELDCEAMKKAVDDMAKLASKEVVLAYAGWTSGLERKVIVYLTGRDEDVMTGIAVALWDRCFIVSRCSSQLIVVQSKEYPFILDKPTTVEGVTI